MLFFGRNGELKKFNCPSTLADKNYRLFGDFVQNVFNVHFDNIYSELKLFFIIDRKQMIRANHNTSVKEGSRETNRVSNVNRVPHV